MLTINKYDYIQYITREEKFESDTVLDLVWDKHCDARSHIKSYQIPYKKLKKFDPISKCPLNKSVS